MPHKVIINIRWGEGGGVNIRERGLTSNWMSTARASKGFGTPVEIHNFSLILGLLVTEIPSYFQEPCRNPKTQTLSPDLG